MVGAYSEPWRIWREKKGQDYVTWKETIPKESVLFPIMLSRILSNLILQLKVEYIQTDVIHNTWYLTSTLTSRLMIVSREAKKKQPYATNE